VAIFAAVPGSRKAAEFASGFGLDKVYLLKLEDDAPLEVCYVQLAKVIEDEGADLVLVGATKRGKTLAALLAEKLDSGLATEAVLRVEDGSLVTERFVYGGLAIRTDVFVSGIPIVSISPRTWEPPEPCGVGATEIVEIPCESAGIRVLERKPRPGSSLNLEEAEVVICVGRGVKKKEDLAMFEELAELLGGVVACTRPVAEEEGYHWFPEDSYIGISGRKVKPRLYISVGSSGQVQHLAGCRDAKILVGIDKNEDVPLFESSDYGIVGDLYEVIPELISKIKELKSS